MTRFCEVTEAEARDILTRAGLKPTRILAAYDQGVYAYLASLPDDLHEAGKRLREAGGLVVMWNRETRAVWFHALADEAVGR